MRNMAAQNAAVMVSTQEQDQVHDPVVPVRVQNFIKNKKII